MILGTTWANWANNPQHDFVVDILIVELVNHLISA